MTNLTDLTATSLVGPLTGNVIGDLTGNVAGNVVGNVRMPTQALTATGAVTITSGVLTLAHGTNAIAATLPAPAGAGCLLVVMNTSATGTAAHTVKTAAGVTLDGTNNTATLNAPEEALVLMSVSTTRWLILVNIGTVGLSST
jgi:hypothetical protein